MSIEDITIVKECRIPINSNKIKIPEDVYLGTAKVYGRYNIFIQRL